MAKNLFDGDSSDEELQLTLNENYVNRYETWRRKEEIQKLKDKYGEEVLSESSDCCSDSDDDTDDDDEPQLNDVFDEQFFKAFAAVKRRDASIYDKDRRFFSNTVEPVASSSKKQQTANKSSMSLKEYHINLIEKKKGITEEDEEPQCKEQAAGYYEELNNIKNELKAVLNENQKDRDGDDFLLKTVPSNSTEENKTKKNVLIELDEHDDDLLFIKNYWSEKSNKLDENERFLRDYIVNERYLEPECETHVERVLSHNSSKKEESEVSDSEVKEDSAEEHLHISKYHFEEPEGNTIKRYPRSVDSVRDVSSKEMRSNKRREKKEKKKKEKEMELQRLREMKRIEIKEKLQKLAEISGNSSLMNTHLDVDLLVDDDTDFDPTKYDEKMTRLFDEQYYNVKGEQKKPEFEFLEGIDDVEYDDKIIESNSKKTKRKKKQEKDPASKQNVGIFEDLIGKDLATRFKYRKVPENDFGLTSEELLYADDKELNKWVSLKRISQYRTDDEELFDQKSYATKKSMLELKKKIFKSLYGESKECENDDESNKNNCDAINDSNNTTQSDMNQDSQEKKKKKKKKKRRKNKTDNADNGVANVTQQRDETNNNESSATKRGKRKRKRKMESHCNVSLDRLKSYGLTNRELKKRKLT